MNIDKRWMVLAAVPSAFGLAVPAVAQAQAQAAAPTAVVQQVQQPGPPGYPFAVPGCNDYIDPWEDSVPEGGQPHYDRLDNWCENWQGDDDPEEGENGVVPEDGVVPEGGDGSDDDGGGTIYMN